MLHITYRLDRSGKHGIGLFSAQDIKKGDLVYTASPILDVNISQGQFDLLSKNEQEEVKYWGFFDLTSGLWHVDFDVSKFINHASDATLTQDDTHDEAYLVATREVKTGEELTQNYLEFESEEDLRKRGIAP